MKLDYKANGLLCLVVVLLVFGRLFAGSGGPDPYGYIWKDSNEPGITFQWVDVTNRPGAVQLPGLADDNAVGPLSIGWDFHYYWSDYSSIKIGSNGWISFSNIGNIASCFPAVPTAGGVGDNIVAPFMSDLTFISNDVLNPNQGELWYWTNNVDSFVIQWVNVPWWKNATPDWIGSNTFELILSGRDSSITFQYQNTDAANFPGGTGCPTYLEIGIENVTGNLGLNHSTGNTIPPDNYVVKYIYPSGAAFLVPDATPVWNVDADNAGQFVYLNAPVILETNVANVGNTPITTAITAIGRLRDLQLVEAWSDSTATTGLVNGDNVTLAFGDTVRLTTQGQYYFDVVTETGGGQDINPTNNNNSIEVVGIDNAGGQVTLSFASGLPPSESVSWAGGNPNDGVALKMVPPDFPAIIDSVRVYIIGDGDLQTPPPVGFAIKIYGLDGNGAPDPNNLLGSTTVSASNVLEDAWNSVAMGPSISIASGGFAVAWMQQGSGISLGAEQYGPISRRSYEILGGSWAPYRSRETTEFLIQVVTDLPVARQEPTQNDNALMVFPNPSNGLSTVRYALQRPGNVEFVLLDLQGRVLLREIAGSQPSGLHAQPLELGELANGVYFLQMMHLGVRSTVKVVLAK
ncbi:MAG: hypothetical protein RLZZ519_3079 [Bacteroidota bacterium]